VKVKKTFLDKKNEEYKKDWSKKNPNMKRDQPLSTRNKHSQTKARGGKK
jgi:hypothetical protein